MNYRAAAAQGPAMVAHRTALPGQGLGGDDDRHLRGWHRWSGATFIGTHGKACRVFDGGSFDPADVRRRVRVAGEASRPRTARRPSAERSTVELGQDSRSSAITARGVIAGAQGWRAISREWPRLLPPLVNPTPKRRWTIGEIFARQPPHDPMTGRSCAARDGCTPTASCNRRANRWAAVLTDRGCRPGRRRGRHGTTAPKS